MCPEVCGPLSARDERHIMSRPGEKATVDAANDSGADDGDLHWDE
jgi:hypothetical protein